MEEDGAAEGEVAAEEEGGVQEKGAAGMEDRGGLPGWVRVHEVEIDRARGCFVVSDFGHS